MISAASMCSATIAALEPNPLEKAVLSESGFSDLVPASLQLQRLVEAAQLASQTA